MGKDLFIERQIGDKRMVMRYEPGHKEYAQERLDKQEAEYLDACEVSQMDVMTLANELEGQGIQLEEIKQETCAKCGSRSLKERRGRMRVFGGLFWTDSKPSPYKHCELCGHDQENNPYQLPSTETFVFQATHRIERAKKLKAKYELQHTKGVNGDET